MIKDQHNIMQKVKQRTVPTTTSRIQEMVKLKKTPIVVYEKGKKRIKSSSSSTSMEDYMASS